MTKYKVHIDTEGFTSKPSNDEIRKIYNRAIKQVKEVTIEELIKETQNGKTVIPAVLSGTKAEDFIQQQLFYIDIDNDVEGKPILNPFEAIEDCKKKGIPVTFHYYSFSSTKEKPKFRLVFVCDEVITDPNMRMQIIKGLLSLFPQADQKCTNANRFYYGTNNHNHSYNPEASFKANKAIELYMQTMVKKANKEKYDKPNKYENDLSQLVDSFDFYGYLCQCNGEINTRSNNYIQFKNCEVCGHHNDLSYYPNTNTFFCFGGSSSPKAGGDIIEYLIHRDGLTKAQAIHKFKYELCGIDEKADKQKYAVKKQNNKHVKRDVISFFHEIKAHQRGTNDRQLSELFSETYKGICRYNPEAKTWYVFNGKVWVKDVGGVMVSKLAAEFTANLLIYANTIEINSKDKNQQAYEDDKKKAYIDQINKYNGHGRRDTLVKDAKRCYPVYSKEFDRHKYLLNCKNGILDLKTFELHPHNPIVLLTKIAKVEYDPEAKAEVFEKFIDEVMQGDEEKIRYLQKALGYALTGDTSMETLFILFGETARNGKSTLVETIAYMLGNTSGYAITMNPDTLANSKNKDGSKASGDIARLKSARFVNAPEPPKRMQLDVAKLKNLTGRDTQVARRLYENEFEFIPEFKMFMNTNYLPIVNDDTIFNSNRINVITFDRHFEDWEQDKSLKNKLRKKAEISGVLNWCIEGLKMFMQEGLNPPEVVKKATKHYQEISDTIGIFLSEAIVYSKGDYVKGQELYENYTTWCNHNGYNELNMQNFYSELRTKKLLTERVKINGKRVRNVIKNHRKNDEFESSVGFVEITDNYERDPLLKSIYSK